MHWLKRFWGIFGKRDVHSQQVPDTMLDLKAGDPCWCGTDKKYKNCHLADDRRQLREAFRGGIPLSRNPFV